MTIKEMVEQKLREGGFDGLVSAGCCACKLGDLMPCGGPFVNCEAGHLAPCDCDGGCDFHIVKEKPGESAEKEETEIEEELFL